MKKIKRAKPSDSNKTIIAGIIAAIILAIIFIMYWQGVFGSRNKFDVEQPQQSTPVSPGGSGIGASDSEPATAESSSGKKGTCQEVSTSLQTFFNNLDNQEYIAAYGLTEGSQKHFAAMLTQLFAKPPVVIRETDDLLAVLVNTAYFYRTLGAKDVSLAKDVMAHEKEQLESVMADIYTWSTLKGCDQQGMYISLPLKDLYEYAGFLINTLGGQSYLNRREPAIRILVKYYCILVIERANAEGLNQYGLDLQQPIDSLIEEINASQELKGKEEYLRTLLPLRHKYKSRSTPITGETPQTPPQQQN